MSTKGTKKCDIFISYRRDGGDMTAMYIYQELKERKYDVFYDLEVLRAGRFNDSLLEYIASCKDFILVLSPGALDRCNEEGDWVRKEIAEALRLKKNIIPIMLKGFKFPDKLPDEIDDVRYQNGLTATTEYFKESMDRLCSKYMQTKPAKKTPVVTGGVAAGVVFLAAVVFGRGFLPSEKTEPEPVPVMTEAITEKVTEKEAQPVTEKATEKKTEKATEKITEAEKTEPVSDTDWPVMRSDNPWGLYNGEYVRKSPDLDASAMGEVANMPVFQNESVLRKDVSSVTFLNTLENAGEDAWDISENQDGSVLAWTKKNGDFFDLYIAGEGGVRISEDCAGLFSMYRNAKTIEFNGCLDTSETDNFTSFFEGCTSLKSLDLRTLDTSSAKYLSSFVAVCEKLTSIDVSTFDTSRAIDMHGMFSQDYALKSLDITNFKTSRVTDMIGMFMDDTKLKNVKFGSGFDTSHVTSMEGMFWNCSNLQEVDVTGFDTSNVTSMEGMFWGCRDLLELDLSGFDTAKVTNVNSMFDECELLENIGTEEGMLYNQLKGNSSANEAEPETATELVKTEPVKDTDWPVMMHDSPWALYDGEYTHDSPENECYGNGEVCNMPVFQNEAILRKDVSSVTFLNTLENAGEDAWDISENQDGSVLAWTEKNGELYDLYIAGEGGVRASEDCPGLFLMYCNAESIELNGYFDTSENNNFDSFFEGCAKVKTLDLRTMDTSSARNLAHLFNACTSLTSLDVSTFDTSRVENMAYFMTEASSLKSVDISSFNTKRVTDMCSFFSACEKLKQIILGNNFDTSRVTNMDSMFWACHNLRELDVSGFDTSNVTTMNSMFGACSNLLELDLSGFDTAKVKNVRSMFDWCDLLETIGTEEGMLYDQFIGTKNRSWSRPDMMIDTYTDYTVSVIWKEGEEPVNCAAAYDEASGHSYVFVNCPATAQLANGYFGDDRYTLIISSEEELEFLENWAEKDNLNFNETWLMGNADPVSVYGEQPEDMDLKQEWEAANSWISNDYPGEKIYFVWADSDPLGNGHWLQLFQEEDNGKVTLRMDDLNDELRRPFIMEVDYKVENGEKIDLSWLTTGGNEIEGYGEEIGVSDTAKGRVDENGVCIISGAGETSLVYGLWYNFYIQEAIVKEGITDLGFHTFDGCRNLTSITLPEGLKSIGECAFSDTALTTITIPSSVTLIHDAAFDGMERKITICAEEGSYAEGYAKKKGMKFQAIPAKEGSTVSVEAETEVKETKANAGTSSSMKTGTVSVHVEAGEKAIDCPYVYDKESGHSYVFVTKPKGRIVVDKRRMDGGTLVTINSREELAFITAWAKKEKLNFNEVWIQGICSPADIDPEKPKKAWKQVESSPNRYIEWADGKPDGSGNWLELVQWRSNGEVFTKMSDVGDGNFRKFILEYDTELNDGAELFR